MAKMTTRAWRSWAARTLVPRPERPRTWKVADRDWGVADKTVAATPTDRLAQGLAYSRSRSGESFHADAWVMPLYIPCDFIVLSWSKTLTSRAGSRNFECPAPETRETYRCPT
jgi:hypothetical protein